jgi:flagellar biosynthesis protein FlhF
MQTKMDIRTYQGTSLHDVLRQIREDLGDDAKILHTRLVKRGFPGLFWGRSVVEVAAAPGMVGTAKSDPAISQETAMPDAEFDYRTQYRTRLTCNDTNISEIDDLESVLSGRSAEQAIPEASFELFAELIEADVDETLARELARGVEGGLTRADARGQLIETICESFTTTGGIELAADRPRVVALVGPTGVGKTTTIAKLAANFRLRDNRRVGLITVDTFRVAAVEQLRTYADIIDLPMEVVSTPDEIREAVAAMSDLDLILMDTAGRSPRDVVRIRELKHMLSAAKADDVMLVLSCTASSRSLQATCREFSPVGATSVVFTKLDESLTTGHLLAVMRETQLPVSYLTDGQNVPDDIAIAEAHSLVRRILGYSHDQATV